MASLSLPRVLQSRKTSLEVEREHFEKAQNIALHKAINKEEVPVKQKHVRSAIIGTFTQQGAHIFWTIALRLQCMDDMIVAWKFCHVLHKILREGHPLCIEHSQKHVQHLEDLGKLWGHLEEGYGKLIRQYTKVLIAKLTFHKKNPRFPGNLNLTTEDLKNILGNNPDICFQLSVEIFDYLDAILELQKTVFKSKASSMTLPGQCRLAPMISCIQDASRLYDHNVKILFFLYQRVHADLMEGHRERFLKQFQLLKVFYQNTNTMQYFRHLISVPLLPEHPPNFQGNFNSYVTQEVMVSQEEEPHEGNLIDTSDSNDNGDSNDHQNSIPQDYFDKIMERDNIIKNLREDSDQLKFEIERLYSINRKERAGFQEQVATLESKLALKENELMHEKQASEAAAVSQGEQKSSEEKFKPYYLKLRGEHITLLREKAKIEKNLRVSEQRVREIEQTNETIVSKLNEVEKKFTQVDEELQQTKGQKMQEISTIQADNKSMQQEVEMLKKNIIDAFNEKVDTERELKSLILKNEELNFKINELNGKLLEQTDEIKTITIKSSDEIAKIVKKSIESNETCVSNAIEEIDNPALSAVTCSPDYLRTLTNTCQETLKFALNISNSEPDKLIITASKIAHTLSMYILQGRATSNTSPDILFGEKMAETCKILGESTLTLLKCLKENSPIEKSVETALNHLSDVVCLAETISGTVKGENLDSLLESELLTMDKAIEEAAKKIQDMLSNSRKADSGVKLQVNERILDSCTRLMEAIRILVQKSRLLQEEIIGQGKGSASAKEFYKRNHRWTDGFISAAKAVGAAAMFLLNAADKVVGGEGKLEQLVVAAHEISACTAQLVVASRVKANKNSTNLQKLTLASKDVTSATGNVVGTVKDCSVLIDETTDVDTSNMSLHQAKRLEMTSQVRVLELEKELQQERLRLSALRRYHYQLEGEEELINK